MTTSIKVTAHCNPKTTEVLVRRTNSELLPVVDSILQDGESFEYYVHDDMVLTVREIKKEVI